MSTEFQTTSWGMVVTACADDEASSREALGTLCRQYWRPLYAFVQRQGYDREAAADLTQAYFARLLEKDYLREVDPNVGRFRTFLLSSLKHFIANDRRRERRAKRGGGRQPVPIDVELIENPRDDPSTAALAPDRFYEQRWAMVVLERALDRVSQRYAAEGKKDLFEQLRPFLSGGDREVSYRETAVALGRSQSAVRMAVHRARRRFRKALRDEVATTVSTPEQIDDEIRHLFAALTA